MRRRHLITIVVGLTGLAVVVALLGPRVTQPLNYHQFADQRRFFGISNAWNVLSNLAFLGTGAIGLIAIIRGGVILNPARRIMYLAFFLGIIFTAFGSAYYHLVPDNERLLWDRLPMTVAFTSLVAATVDERVDARLAHALFPLLLVAGLAAALWWHWSALHGKENLLPYIMVQAHAMLLLLVLALLVHSRSGNHLLAVVALYVLAKGAEHYDQALMGFTGFVSGHTLKHLLAALGGYWIFIMLQQRSRR